MSEPLLKHSRMPRKQRSLPRTQESYTVAKRPLGNIPANKRAEIADQVLARYMTGEQVANMAGEYNTSDVTIYALLLREREEEWKGIQTARALARLERAQDRLETAQDALELAKAREQVRSAQWELERLLKRLYGEDRNINLNVTVGDLGDRLRRARERVIEGNPQSLSLRARARAAEDARIETDALVTVVE